MNTPIRHCSLTGHEWVPCHGGKACSECGAVDLLRDVVLPRIEDRDYDGGDLALWCSMLFLLAALGFGILVFARFYA